MGRPHVNRLTFAIWAPLADMEHKHGGSRSDSVPPPLPWSPLVIAPAPLRFLLLALMALAACNNDPKSPTSSEEASDGADGAEATDGADGTDGTDGTDGLVGPHDGDYSITMHRAGGQFALGTFSVVRNAVTADVRSEAGVTFTATGTVATDGALTVSVSNDAGLSVAVPSGWIRGDVVEAVYTVEGEQGVIVGTKDGSLVGQAPVTDFDGNYEVAFIRDEEEVANTTFEVKRGSFKTQITAEDGAIYIIDGFVTSDGTVVLAQATSTREAVILAEASIDQDTLTIAGIYRAGDLVGAISGRKGD